MATEGGTWNNLPSVILIEVFKYLPRNDTISASSTCRQWRQHLYHATLWRNIAFEINRNEESVVIRNRFLASCFAKKLRSATVRFNSMDPVCVEEAARVVKELSKNPDLQKFHLRPSHSSAELPVQNGIPRQFLERNGIQMLHKIITTSLHLEELTLGCMEDVARYSKELMSLLALNQSSSLRVLGLATLKEDPEDYLLPDIDGSLFQSFRHLQILSVDYDNVDDRLLLSLNNGQMKRLVIHVHGITDTHTHTSDTAWKTFTLANPLCELRLSLVHSYDAVGSLHNSILRPSMPLTHLRALFCEQMNVIALQQLSLWYAKTLCSIQWVDSLESADSNALADLEEQITLDHAVPNPLIMCAWRCVKLEEIVLIGYKIWENALFALFRLSKTLCNLEIGEEDILLDESETMEKLEQDLSNELGTTWKPKSRSDLADVILNPHHGDSDDYVLPIVASDLAA